MVAGSDKAIAVVAGAATASAGVASENPWAQFGLAGLVVGVVIYQSWARERRMADRIDLLEDRQDTLIAENNQKMSEIIADHNAKMNKMNERSILALEQVATTMAQNTEMIAALSQRGCPYNSNQSRKN